MNSHILQGDALERLRELPDESVDTVITDPPYGYSFMGKDWDKAVPSVEIWQECLRVLKPGAFACVMSAPRSDVQQAMTERLIRAGFRLDFTPIYWTYASGFPKAGNIGKLVDKRLGAERQIVGTRSRDYPDSDKWGVNKNANKNGGFLDEGKTKRADISDEGEKIITAPATDQAKALDGSYAGFQPKPAVEVVIIAMKPLSEKTYVDQALKNGKGITWLDDCRVPTDLATKDMLHAKASKNPTGVKGYFVEGVASEPHVAGRFPANLLVSDDVLNDGVERKTNSTGKGIKSNGTSIFGNGKYHENNSKWGDSGSYSRYFDLDKWAQAHLPAEQAMTFPFAIFPKASKSEKNKGLEHLPDQVGNLSSMTTRGERERGESRDVATFKNHHPTVKPLKLMSYLITLFSREGDTVLDPFVGSGTTVVAAEQLGRIGIGIEREAEYAEIARARVEYAKAENEY